MKTGYQQQLFFCFWYNTSLRASFFFIFFLLLKDRWVLWMTVSYQVDYSANIKMTKEIVLTSLSSSINYIKNMEYNNRFLLCVRADDVCEKATTSASRRNKFNKQTTLVTSASIARMNLLPWTWKGYFVVCETTTTFARRNLSSICSRLMFKLCLVMCALIR